MKLGLPIALSLGFLAAPSLAVSILPANPCVPQGTSFSCPSVYNGAIGASASPSPATAAGIQSLWALRDNMHQRWQALDAACDPDAVFALTYLFMTDSVASHVANNYFDFNEDMVTFTRTFANYYITAIDNWKNGNRNQVPQAWKTAFSNADAQKTLAEQDLFLGMNAHINRDLAYVVNDLKMKTDHKPDYNRINDILQETAEPVNTQIVCRYSGDPLQTNPVLGAALLQMISGWRENAWQNGKLMQFNPLQKIVVDTAAAAIANLFAINLGTNAQRVQYCQSQQAANACPPLQLTNH
ncbi:hypothetical protein SpCBS45565_g06612 [Spizellomyces sp. 'palustris']|nr:hypothetical protein SpCBS45565_g06612 [Spizellomyces sp. 'palustris']